MAWWNAEHLHSACGDLPPVDVEAASQDRLRATTEAAWPDPPATSIDRGHLERRRHQLGLETAAGRIEERPFLTAIRRMKEQEAAADVEQATWPAVDAARARDCIRDDRSWDVGWSRRGLQ